jgi:hypothetical protein
VLRIGACCRQTENEKGRTVLGSEAYANADAIEMG